MKTKRNTETSKRMFAACSLFCGIVLGAAELPFPNPGFEEDSGWGGSGKLTEDQKNSGKRSLLLEKGYAHTVLHPEILPGKDYVLSFRMKTEKCTPKSVSIQAVCLGGPEKGDRKWLTGWMQGGNPEMIHDSGSSAALIATGGTFDWKEFRIGIPKNQIHPQTQALMLYLRRDAVKNPTGKVWFDDFKLTELSPGESDKMPELFPTPKQIVFNGGFEQGKLHWSGSGVLDSDEKASGEKSLLLEKGFAHTTFHPPLKTGRDHFLTLRVKTQNCTENSVSVQAVCLGGPMETDRNWQGGWLRGNFPVKVHDNGTSNALMATGGTHEWKEFKIPIPRRQIFPDTHALAIYLRRDAVKEPEGKAWFDDIRLEEVPYEEVRKMPELFPEKKQERFNSDFENGMKHWSGSGQIVQDTKHSGEKSMLIEKGIVSNTYFPEFRNRDNYFITFYLKTENCPADAVTVRAICIGGPDELDQDQLGKWIPGMTPVFSSGNPSVPALFAAGGTHDWKAYTVAIPKTQLAHQTRGIQFVIEKNDPAGKAYLDDITFERVWKNEDFELRLNRKALKIAPAGEVLMENRKKLEAFASEKPENLILFDKRTTDYGITVGNETQSVEIFAALELNDYLNRISGMKNEPLFHHDAAPGETPQIVIGKENELTKKFIPDSDFAKLGTQGFLIRSVGRHIFIAGNTPAGTLYGTFYFLDHLLGVRWFSDEYTFVPKQEKMELKSLSIVQIPRYEYREIFAADGDDETYRMHNLLNGKSHHRMVHPSRIGLENIWIRGWADDGHNFQRIVDFKKYGKSNPEYFEGGQLAMMNPDVRQIAAAHFLSRLQDAGGYKGIPFGMSQEDRSFGLDKEGQAFADEHGGVVSAPLIDMLTAIGNEVREVFPEARFSTLAYQATLPAPENMDIPDFIRICVAPIDSDFSEPFNSERNRKHTGKAIADWAKAAKDVYIWDYITNFSAYTYPYPNIRALFSSIQWMGTQPSIRGYFGQGSMASQGAELAYLRQWIGARLLWNPKQDVEALIQEFVRGFYGPAAPYIMEYIALFENAVKKEGGLFLKTELNNPIYSFEVMHKADELLTKAADAVKGVAPFEKHVATLRVGTDAILLLKRGDFAEDAKSLGIEWNVDKTARLARIRESVKNAKITRYGESTGSMDGMIEVMELDRKKAIRPEIFKDLADSDYMEYQDLVLLLFGGKLVSDAKASDAVAAFTDGQSGTWAIQWRCDFLPPGEWEVYIEARADLNPNASDDANAFSFGIYPTFDNMVTVKASELRDGNYHLLKLPGSYINDAGRAFWAAGIKGGAAKGIYIDRLIAIRKK